MENISEKTVSKDKQAKIIIDFLFVVSCVYIAVKGCLQEHYIAAALGPVCCLFLFIPPLGQKILRIRLDWHFHAMIVVFCFLAFNLGTALDWYERFPPFNYFVHGLSGVLFTLIGFCMYKKIKKQGIKDIKTDWFLQLAFAYCFSMFIAVFWEIGEYLSFITIGHDSQHTLTTGVFDTMYDIISCVIGSFLVAAEYCLYTKKGKRLFIVRALEGFYRDND